MTLHLLDVEPRDVTAGALGLVVDADAPAALAELTIDDAVGTVTLGVLGASHVVTATVGADRLIEQVSCDAVRAGGRPLPVSESVRGYHFESDTETVDRAQLADTAAWLRQRATDTAGWICGSFPGDRTALTALTAETTPVGGWIWQTWHLYPGESDGVIVKTRSRWKP